MASKIQTFLIGTSGIVGSEVTAQVTDNISIPFHDWTTALTQLVIAVATLFGLFRKSKRR